MTRRGTKLADSSACVNTEKPAPPPRFAPPCASPPPRCRLRAPGEIVDVITTSGEVTTEDIANTYNDDDSEYSNLVAVFEFRPRGGMIGFAGKAARHSGHRNRAGERTRQAYRTGQDCRTPLRTPTLLRTGAVPDSARTVFIIFFEQSRVALCLLFFSKHDHRRPPATLVAFRTFFVFRQNLVVVCLRVVIHWEGASLRGSQRRQFCVAVVVL